MRKRFLILFIIIVFSVFLRLWKIDKVPVSLFGDELDVGYQAYSILKTGRDYSGRVMPIQFRSFTEYRTPLYLYSAVPTVAIFGISPFGVRLPAVLFGVLGVIALYLLTKEISQNEYLGLISAFLLAISPWHIHYSRAGFEVTLLITLYLFGLYFFLNALKKPVWFIPSAIFFALTPWVYSTAKLYLPLTAIFLFFVWFKGIFDVSGRKYLIIAGIIFLLISVPYGWSTFFGGGMERFSTLSIFNDPVMEGTVGSKRLEDKYISLLTTKLNLDRLFHNKYTFWLSEFSSNYFKTFSTEFLFVNGDGNPRHNSSGSGELYATEAAFLIIGFYCFNKAKIEKRRKWLVIFLLMSASIPSSLTRDGSNHATRLILLLPPLIIIISFGIYGSYVWLSGKYKSLFLVLVGAVYLINFISYQHYYWIHYSLDTEKGWQNGWERVIKGAKEYSSKYNKVIISSRSDPAFLYFLAWTQYPPKRYQEEKDFSLVDIEGFGKSKRLGNVYFPLEYGKYNLYDIGSVLDNNSLYIASFDEIKWDLVKDPGRLPLNLSLIETVRYVSGEPAFYFLTKR